MIPHKVSRNSTQIGENRVLVEPPKSRQSLPVPFNESNENFLSEVFDELRYRARIDIDGPIFFVTIGAIDHVPNVPMEPRDELEPYRVFGTRCNQTGYELAVGYIRFHDVLMLHEFHYSMIPLFQARSEARIDLLDKIRVPI